MFEKVNIEINYPSFFQGQNHPDTTTLFAKKKQQKADVLYFFLISTYNERRIRGIDNRYFVEINKPQNLITFIRSLNIFRISPSSVS